MNEKGVCMARARAMLFLSICEIFYQAFGIKFDPSLGSPPSLSQDMHPSGTHGAAASSHPGAPCQNGSRAHAFHQVGAGNFIGCAILRGKLIHVHHEFTARPHWPLGPSPNPVRSFRLRQPSQKLRALRRCSPIFLPFGDQ